MIYFQYDSCFKISQYNKAKQDAKKQLNWYIQKSFPIYKDLNITIMMLPDYSFEDSIFAISIPDKKIIKFNFDKYYDYFRDKKIHNGKLIMPTTIRKHNLIFNSLFHEMQHIVNSIEYKVMFDYISEIDSFGYVKVGISSLFDEYVASYLAHKQIYVSYGAINGLEQLCGQKDNIIALGDESKKLTLYLGIVNALSYTIAECKILNTIKDKSDYFNDLLGKKSIIDFADVFRNIQLLLENYKLEEYKEYVDNCKYELIKLLRILHVDFNFLKEIDEY